MEAPGSTPNGGEGYNHTDKPDSPWLEPKGPEIKADQVPVLEQQLSDTKPTLEEQGKMKQG